MIKVKSQQVSISKKWIEKLKTIKKDKENNILKDNNTIIMDNDRSSTCIVVNEKDPNDSDELDSASSSNSGLEVEEE